MAKTVIAPGAVIDTPTAAEMAEHLGKAARQWFAEQARGVTLFRFDHTDTVSGSAITIPAAGEQIEGPRAGFVWVVAAVRAQGLATGDVLNIWRNNAKEPRNFLGTVTAAAPATVFSAKSVILKGGEKLIFTGASLMATGDITVNGEGLEAGEVDLYKIV